MHWLKRLFRGAGSDGQTEAAMKPDIEARVRHLTQPAVHLRGNASNGFSRLGGLPRLPRDAEWPLWKGKPLAFLAQIDLREVHRAVFSFLPAEGFLYFFFDQEQSVWGFDPEDAGAWRVLYFNGDPTIFAERAAPAGLDKDAIYHAKPIAPQSIVSWPDSERFPSETLRSDKESDLYVEISHSAFGSEPKHQMLGFPSPVQSDGMEEQCQFAANGVSAGDAENKGDPRIAALKAAEFEWKLLLQLDSDDDAGWMWGDCGTLYFWVREADARQGDFSKVWMILQCS